MTMTFAELTAIRRDGTDRFVLDVDASSFIARGPNGGYIAAVLLRALQARVDDLETADPRAPRSLTVHYPSPPVTGPAVITTEIVRAGRSLVTTAARLHQDGAIRAFAVAAFSAPWPGQEWTDLDAPRAPGPDEVADLGVERTPLPFLQYWEHRFTRWRTTPVDDTTAAVTEGWIRLAQPGPVDGAVIAAMTDAFPPAVFTRLEGPNPVPTVDLTVHFRTGLPPAVIGPDEFLLGRFRTRTVAEGFLEEDGQLWTERGTLVAQSRQLAVMLPG